MKIVFLIVFLFMVFFNNFVNPFVKELIKFNKTLDFEKYEREINILLSNNLHTESRCYLNLMYNFT